jgi:aromatic ring-opening dioxygenase catalytic subunit (LigB family)
MTAKLVVDPENAISIVPVYINANMPVPPSPGRCYALGGVLRQTVEALRPADERVVVVGHGGLSHWLATTGQGRTNAEFDLDFMDRMIAGKSNELAQYESDEIVAADGNGALELVSWLFMAGSLPQVQGQKIYYENMPEWITGMGGLALIPQGAE